jgi:hypothetical protein
VSEEALTFMTTLFLGMKNIPVGPINLAALAGQNMSIIAHVVPASELRLNQLQAEGGKCPKCGKDWNRRHYKNRLAEFDIYIPACTCYPRCPMCNRVLMVEIDERLDGCTYCGPIFCTAWVKKEVATGEGKFSRQKKATPCGGACRPFLGGFVCSDCGAENQIIRIQRSHP